MPGARLSTRGRRPVVEKRRLAGRLGRQANGPDNVGSSVEICRQAQPVDRCAVFASARVVGTLQRRAIKLASDSSSRSWVNGTAGLVARQNPHEAAREETLKQLFSVRPAAPTDNRPDSWHLGTISAVSTGALPHYLLLGQNSRAVRCSSRSTWKHSTLLSVIGTLIASVVIEIEIQRREA